MNIPFSYLEREFDDIELYLDDIRNLVETTDFTLGTAVNDFEATFAKYIGLPYAVGVGSGTDALILSLKRLGIGPGDEVIRRQILLLQRPVRLPRAHVQSLLIAKKALLST